MRKTIPLLLLMLLVLSSIEQINENRVLCSPVKRSTGTKKIQREPRKASVEIITNEQISCPALRGNSIYFVVDDSTAIKRYNAHEKNFELLVDSVWELLRHDPEGFVKPGEGDFVVSPDGSMAIYTNHVIDEFDVINRLIQWKNNSRALPIDELNGHMHPVRWLSRSKNIIYGYTDVYGAVSNIMTSQLDGTHKTKMVDFDKNIESMIVVPDGKSLGIYTGAIDGHGGENDIYTLNLSTRELYQITKDGYSLDPVWFNSDQLVWSRTDGNPYDTLILGEKLHGAWTTRALGIQTRDQDMGASPKYAWLNKRELVVAVPKSEATFSNGFNESPDGDRLFIYDIVTDQKREIVLVGPSAGRVTVRNMMVSGDGKRLYFTDRGKLRAINIQ